MSYPLAELPVRIEDLEINGPDVYGYAPLAGAPGALQRRFAGVRLCGCRDVDGEPSGHGGEL